MKSVLSIVMIVFLFLWGGFALSLMWEWLIIPIWPELIHLTMWQAMGLSVFLSYFTVGIAREKYEDIDNAIARLFIGFGQSLIVLAMAWLVSLSY